MSAKAPNPPPLPGGKPPASPPPPPPPAPADPFTAALFRVLARPAEQLSPVELRLIRIAAELLVTTVALARSQHIKAAAGEPPGPLDTHSVAEGARLAFAAAVEMERPLRDIRDALASREPAS